MVRIKNILLTVIALALTCVSCIEPISLKTEEEDVVTLNCILTQEPVQELTLCYSKAEDAGNYVPITKAEVKLYEENVYVGDFVWKESDKWALDYTPIPGKEYSIKAKIDGHKDLIAKTRLPIATLGLYRYPYDLLSSDREPIICLGIEAIVPEDAVLWIYAINMDGKLAEYLATDHSGLDMFNASVTTLLTYKGSDTFLGGDIVKLPSNEKQDFPLMQRRLRIEHTKDYYQKLGWCYTQRGWANDTTTLFRIAASCDDSRNEIVVMCVSEELDKYMLSTWNSYLLDGTVEKLYSTENMFTNIENGVGFFGGAYILRQQNVNIRDLRTLWPKGWFN